MMLTLDLKTGGCRGWRYVRKKQIMARLLGAQRAFATNPNTFLINLQNQLTNEYNEILQLEEELWAMKSRVNWTIFWERNTSFFHMTTLARRSRNRISSIMNDEGVWVHDVEQVQEVFTKSFVKLYQTDQSACPRVQRWDFEWCMRLEMNEANVVGLMPSNREIWDALKSMKPYKAPGSDGIHAGFYQRFWLLVGESVKNKVKQIFASQKVPAYLNQTLIALNNWVRRLSANLDLLVYVTLSLKLFPKS